MAVMKPPIDSSFGYLLHDVTCSFRKHFDRRAVRFGLTRAQWRALKMIRRSEGLSQIELADAIEIEPIAVGRVIDRLVQSDFVERRADPTDRRCWRLYLTAKAHAITDDMEIIAAELRADSLRGIDRQDVEVFGRVLNQIRANLATFDQPSPSSDS